MTAINPASASKQVQVGDGTPSYFSVSCAAIVCSLGVIALCNAIDYGDSIKAMLGAKLALMENELNQESYDEQNSLYQNGVNGDGHGIPYWVQAGGDQAGAQIGGINSAMSNANQKYQPALKTVDSSTQAVNQAVTSDANDKNSLVQMAGTVSSSSSLTSAMQTARS